MSKLIGLFTVIAVAVIGSAYGWISNIINIFNTENFELSGLLILQVIGIFVAPLGVVMGYLI